jgi:hypothetical protein
MEYFEYLTQKQQFGSMDGFNPVWMPDFLFDFQKSLVDWSLRKGRSALFCDCGLGKTPMQLVWAENILKKTGKPCLIITPLAVSFQTVLEGGKFGIECARSNSGESFKFTTITNYEQLHKFNYNDFAGVVCDESSILKNFEGAHKAEITEFMRKVPYRLLCTATAAPNDFTELGTSSEALGFLGFMDMLNRFFKNDNNNSGIRRLFGEAPTWRFKGHAEKPFWQWVTSWARACRKPSDLGFDDGPFVLPELIERENLVESESLPDGCFLPLHAKDNREQRAEKRRTIEERCQRVLDIVSKEEGQTVTWCQLNPEGDCLEKILPQSVQVSGRDSDDEKEDKFIAFTKGQIKNLITKPKIGAWGMNWQNCNHTISFPSHSYEQYYQSVRRFWRFGQKKPVIVDLVMTEGERKIMNNLQRKNRDAIIMFSNLVASMNDSLAVNKQTKFTKKEVLPSWL